MSELHIAEYLGLGQDHHGRAVPVAHGELAQQVVAITESTAASAPFVGGFVRLFTDAPCYVQFGVSPVATTASIPLASESVEFFQVTPGQRVAVIAR